MDNFETFKVSLEDYVEKCSKCWFCVETLSTPESAKFLSSQWKGKTVKIKCGTSNSHFMPFVRTCGVKPVET